MRDTIEEKIEKEKSSEEMLEIQRSFVEDVSDFLDIILSKKDRQFEAIHTKKDAIFSSLSHKKNYEKFFYTFFKKEYVL
ncbi:hypothetical protein [Candidatus Venteria ishoeyi]|uniref:Uncharacterized protein n=1 Tax=Candidatus Venteria ishoeyi TaxID=1899563 RepID=A0A1H6F8W5_9GAMM|nr:hypothetical protein [Candidatus Venteria ishoeyi]SEH05435.1 Uncharacterised protein [Candidatus Venteria ishoeyi]